MSNSEGVVAKLGEVIKQAAASLGYELKQEQEESVTSGRDVFVSVPSHRLWQVTLLYHFA